jgi:hypothetical protein
MTWALLLLGLPFVGLLGRRAGLGWRPAISAAAIIATTPIIAGHGLFNSKDIPFMTATIIVVWAVVEFFIKPHLKSAIILGIVMGLAILCRINALQFSVMMIGVGALWQFKQWRMLKWIPVSLGIAIAIIYCGCPTLWFSPISEFMTALVRMANYPWTGQVLFNGMYISADSLPWYYIPVWMGITLSPVALVGLAVAVGMIGWKWKQCNGVVIVLAAWAVLPLIVIWIQSPTLYDSWRHLFFIYPPLVILSVLGLSITPRWVHYGFFAAYTISTAIVWRIYFPYMHCYLNEFAGPRESIIYNWETDYWGVSYRELLTTLPAGTSVFPDKFPASMNIELVPTALKVVQKPEPGVVFVTNHRWRKGPMALPTVSEVSRDGFPLVRAYRVP